MSASRIALITGTSSGIGLATAITAAQSGWQVVAAMRNTAKAERLLAAAGEAGVAERIRVMALEVTDSASVAECIDAVLATYGRLDAVVNNAGTGAVGTAEHLSSAGIRAAKRCGWPTCRRPDVGPSSSSTASQDCCVSEPCSNPAIAITARAFPVWVFR